VDGSQNRIVLSYDPLANLRLISIFNNNPKYRLGQNGHYDCSNFIFNEDEYCVIAAKKTNE